MHACLRTGKWVSPTRPCVQHSDGHSAAARFSICQGGAIDTCAVPKIHTPCQPSVLGCVRRRFWQCPNGKECKYRHRLPPGFKLKSEIKELLASEAANKPSLEEEIEAQRQAVEAQTPITEQVRVAARF